MTNPTPGSDWAAKHAAAGQNTSQQHDSYTTADGPVTQHQHPMTDTQVLDMIEGTQ